MVFNKASFVMYFSIISMISVLNGYAQMVNGKFSTTIHEEISYNYLLKSPLKQSTDKPLIIFLHGSGEKGTDIELLKNHGPLAYKNIDQIDAYILAPQCPQNAYWDTKGLIQLIEKIVVENKINRSQIYLTGLSMGAWGAWNLAYANPKTFAALIPIAGFVDRIPLVENCKISHIPTRIYHGILDDVVDPNYSIEIYKKLQKCNQDVTLTLFDNANHDSWTRVYNDPKTYEWLLSQKINKIN